MKTIVNIKNKYGNVIAAEIKILSEEYIQEIMNLQEEILLSLDDKSYFVETSIEEFEDIIKNSGIVIGIFAENKMIAFGAVMKPEKAEYNLGYDLGFGESKLMKIAHIESTAVHKDYRGNKLQKLICEILEDAAGTLGCSIFCATVAPDNKYSLNTFTLLGYRVAAEKEKYGGLKRYIVIKE